MVTKYRCTELSRDKYSCPLWLYWEWHPRWSMVLPIWPGPDNLSRRPILAKSVSRIWRHLQRNRLQPSHCCGQWSLLWHDGKVGLRNWLDSHHSSEWPHQVKHRQSWQQNLGNWPQYWHWKWLLVNHRQGHTSYDETNFDLLDSDRICIFLLQRCSSRCTKFRGLALLCDISYGHISSTIFYINASLL